MIVLFVVLSSAPLQEFKGKTAYNRVIWLIHHTHLYSARQKSTRTATLFLTRSFHLYIVYLKLIGTAEENFEIFMHVHLLIESL